jgi:hypothetical protein
MVLIAVHEEILRAEFSAITRSLQLSLGELVVNTSCFSCGRLFLLALFLCSHVSLPGCGSSSTSSTSEYTLPDDVKAEIKARKDKAKAQQKIKSRNIKTH